MRIYIPWGPARKMWVCGSEGWGGRDIKSHFLQSVTKTICLIPETLLIPSLALCGTSVSLFWSHHLQYLFLTSLKKKRKKKHIS